MPGADGERRGEGAGAPGDGRPAAAARDVRGPAGGPGEAHEPGDRLRCPRCRSPDVRGSRAKTPGERLVRYLTPFHYFRCRTCGHRGRHLGRIPAPPVRTGRAPSITPGRPLERRDLEEALARRRRALWTVLLAVALGALAGRYVHSCAQRGETSAPAE